LYAFTSNERVEEGIANAFPSLRLLHITRRKHNVRDSEQ
jgi:hypothetical protein